MTTFEIVDARPYHCGSMSRGLRHDHRQILMQMGVNVHGDMRSTFDASMLARTFMIDGVPAAIGGVVGSIASSDGMVWFAIRESAVGHWYRLARLAQRQIEEIMRTKTKLTTVVLKDDKASVRLAYFLGFQVLETTSINGARALVMTCERAVQRVA